MAGVMRLRTVLAQCSRLANVTWLISTRDAWATHVWSVDILVHRRQCSVLTYRSDLRTRATLGL